MTALLITSTVTIWSALALAPALAPVPVPELGFALQLAGLGAAVGSAVALRAKHRAPIVDTWRITTAWATLGLAIGIVAIVLCLLL